MTGTFETKEEARQAVWETLEERGLARFPFPPHGRIPNFEGAKDAAERLVGKDPFSTATVVKVNPDAPQRPVRKALLEQGVQVLVPTPRLRGGFHLLDPDRIPQDGIAEASSLSKMDAWARPCPLDELPRLDAIVAGSVAVTRGGRRVGKGEGYSDLEYGILRELGHPDVHVATTVHPVQIVDGVPREATDLALSLIVTPQEAIEVQEPPSAPSGIDWEKLPEGALEEMPVLEELASR